MQSTVIWNSALIQQTLDMLRMNMPVSLEAFHQGDIELKAANLLYQLTQEEVDEFHKCSEDIVYFVEKYCRFLTDKGRIIIKLRPYQKVILKALSEETYIKFIDELGPKNRNVIVMAARQVGKCLFNDEITLLYPSGEMYKIPINLFYYMQKSKLSLLEKIKVKLMILYYKLEK
jgi:hypothetical protein